jgi:hypothetical protein
VSCVGGCRPRSVNLPIGRGVINNHPWRAYITTRDVTQLNMKRDTINASKLLKKKSKATLIEWVPRKGGRANRFVEVEVGASTKASTSRQMRRKRAGSIENNAAIPHASSMDIDETLWIEEPVIPEKKRVSSPTCPPSTVFDIYLSLSAPTSRNSFLRLAPTCVASSTLRVFRLQQHARNACLLHLSGGALTAFLPIYSARSAAENPTSGFPSTGFRSGRESSLCHHGYGRLV